MKGSIPEMGYCLFTIDAVSTIIGAGGIDFAKGCNIMAKQ
jgi:hypothetical protein